MSMSVTAKVMVGAAAGAMALIGVLTPASAHGRHHHHRHFHAFRAPIVVAPSYGAGCDYYHWKWQRTGSRYWKSQYLGCIR